MSIKSLFYLAMAVISGLNLNSCTNNDANKSLKNIPQDIFSFLKPNNADEPLITPEKQNNFYNEYLEHYFSPWTGTFLYYSDDQIQKKMLDTIKTFSANPGWGENKQAHTDHWINNIINNMQMFSFPNANWKGITVCDTALHALPTNDPSFDDWDKPGQGYPFDNLQTSFLKFNTPVLVLQETKDRLWGLVLTHDVMGWIPLQSIANVNDAFIHTWMKPRFLAVIHENTIITDPQKRQNISVKIGNILPFTRCQRNQCGVLLASADDHNNATIHIGNVLKEDVTVMPHPLTQQNIADLMNIMLGEPYGWGGYNGYRDCSSTLQDIFTPFAIWLPRNSNKQSLQGNYRDLTGLSSDKKLQIIFEQGVPFLTLIHLPGHIVVYIGKNANQTYVFQTVWGLHTRNIFFQEGRAIIGKTIIAPIDLGRHSINVPATWLDQADRMTILAEYKNSTT